jgi:hypothetical protein
MRGICGPTNYEKSWLRQQKKNTIIDKKINHNNS